MQILRAVPVRVGSKAYSRSPFKVKRGKGTLARSGADRTKPSIVQKKPLLHG